jgi:hypothetical protein
MSLPASWIKRVENPYKRCQAISSHDVKDLTKMTEISMNETDNFLFSSGKRSSTIGNQTLILFALRPTKASRERRLKGMNHEP